MNLDGALQRQSYKMGCTEDGKFKFVSHHLSDIDLLLDKLMSFLGVFSEFYERCISRCVVVLSIYFTSHLSLLQMETFKRIISFAWVISLCNRANAFERVPLVHICRMMERRAHRKEFRRKGLLND